MTIHNSFDPHMTIDVFPAVCINPAGLLDVASKVSFTACEVMAVELQLGSEQ